MKSKVFTVYDSKMETYMSPFLMLTKGQAIRSFTDAVGNSESQFCTHPEDYTLFEIGEWDDQEGCYTMHEAKISLGCAIEFREQAQVRLAK